MAAPNEYRILNSHIVYQSEWMRVYEDHLRSTNGTTRMVNKIEIEDVVVVLPCLNKRLLMIENYRTGSNSILLEFPGGFQDNGETPEQTARRELIEETGYRCERLIYKGWFYTWPARATQKTHVFLADRLRKDGSNLNQDFEYARERHLTKHQLRQEIQAGNLQSGVMLAALFLSNII